ncbi:MAG: hypothetical protein ACREGG_01900 [Candidatus Saccharimonadales bacterium]
MAKFERSIDIILSEKPAETGSVESVVVPLKSDESLVAARGLARHLDVIYTSVLRNSNADRALLAVYDLLAVDIDQFRDRAHNLYKFLTPKVVENPESKSVAASAIAYLIFGKRSHSTGVWPRGKLREEYLIGDFRAIMAADKLTFHEYADWGIRQVVRNERYWRQQLEQSRSNAHVLELREAIQEADYRLVEV